jgi:ATP-dependent exoDNAse (exonuclease V) beta subunit
MDLARRAERNGVNSFRSFVDWLFNQEQHGEASDAPIVEEGTEGVRVMTVHKAKGLEFPVVVLADITAREAPAEASRWVDARAGLCAMKLIGYSPPELLEHADEEMALEREEAARVVYVATTRARDLLVVPVIGDERRDGWLGALHPVVYPPAERADQAETARHLGCPEFGRDSVTMRPDNVPKKAATVAPGLHRPEMGNHPVVWWDPAALKLNAQETMGLTQTKLLQADEDGIRSEEGVRAHAEWQSRRREVRARGSAPSLYVVTATEQAARPETGLKDLPEVEIEMVGVNFPRPHGQRFGTLVHAILSLVDFDGDRDSVQSLAELQGHLLGADANEVSAAVDTVMSALAHPLLKRAAAAAHEGFCRRETPISMQLEDETIVEGVIDLAFRDGLGGSWTVVDYKTDFEISGRIDEYKTQVALYAYAICKATGLQARGVLLKV